MTRTPALAILLVIVSSGSASAQAFVCADHQSVGFHQPEPKRPYKPTNFALDKFTMVVEDTRIRMKSEGKETIYTH
jgi:hypothetical protein